MFREMLWIGGVLAVCAVDFYLMSLFEKLPEWAFAMVSAGAGWITAESDALAPAEPPPARVTLFCCGEVALAATSMVTVIGG